MWVAGKLPAPYIVIRGCSSEEVYRMAAKEPDPYRMAAKEPDPRVDAIATSDLVSSATLAALVGMLGAKGVLSDPEVREVYEQALFLIEQHQAEAEPDMAPIFKAAREVIETQLR